MTETLSTEAPVPRPRAPRGGTVLRRSVVGLIVALLVVSLALGLIYVNRRAAARQVLTGWLDQRGIEAQVEVDRIEIDGFVGSIRIGDPSDPDVVVERVEVDYALSAPWSSTGTGVTPSRIRLVRPVLRATWQDGVLSLGSLDPLIEEFTGRPPRPDARGPVVIVESGRVRLTTEYGPLQLLGDARLEDGKLMRLQARMPAASLKSGDVEARSLGGTVDLTTTGDRVTLVVEASADAFNTAGGSGEALRLSGRGDLPYPDLKKRSGDGRTVVDLTLAGQRLSWGDADVRETETRLAFDGETRGWVEAFRLRGQTSATMKAGQVSLPGLEARMASIAVADAALNLSRGSAGLGWRLEGPATLQAASARSGDLALATTTLRARRLVAGGRDGAFEASGPVAVTARRFGFGDLSLGGAIGTLDVDVAHDGATLVTASGALRASEGAWPLFGVVAGDDVPELAAMKRALGNFALDMPGISLTTGSPGTDVRLTRPARLVPANGGVLTLQPVARALYSAEPGQLGGGALSLSATRGQGLPEAAFAIPDWRLTPGGFEARLDGRAGLDFGVARGIAVSTAGLLANTGGTLTYVADGCLPFTIERLELDENDATDLSGSLCSTDAPLVTARNGTWRASATMLDVAATTPFLSMQFDQVQGSMVASGSAAGLGLDATLSSARIRDTLEPTRFLPLTASGTAGLAADRWTGLFDVARGTNPLGQVRLAHDGLAAAGGVTLDFPALRFTPDGLQPDDLSPLAADWVQSPVTGSAGFSGRFDWAAPDVASSSGVLRLDDLDFTSPAGAVEGLSGAVTFTSLAPLTTAPGQTLSVTRLDAMAELTDVDLTFELDTESIKVAGGSIAAAGGTVSVEPFVVPLDRTKPFSGVIVLDRVQLGDLVTQAGFGDKVSMDAVVSGRLPFLADPVAGVRILAGSLAAVQPGRLSINRTALTGISAGGGGAVPPGTVEDLAYQAMENLAFDILSAEVNSLDEGRLGVLFRIRGRHDPPQRQEMRVGIAEFISRKFLERTLPLPSDTGIDLTLDTTLNVNQLLSDLLAVSRARKGEPARPEPEATPPVP
ncbi:intermembrane phospholipid transport protein YdbH family protein [Brevundimonas variabilis]|uniref:C4-dicarboxylate ABC transporter n=1 Tax=Brevundimonas variabilis TaxID=74312 RepID=A0A7W9FFE5_9CAUL|nr:YdbH domain-containing protein [Brevundimonas variabilis]MBB5747342.1 hypothetical protein [Brevundimonas variabilis]